MSGSEMAPSRALWIALLLGFAGTAWTAPTLGTASNPAPSCEALLATGLPSSGSGLYWIRIGTSLPFLTECDFTSDGGGWTLIVHLAANTAPEAVPTVAAWASMEAQNDTSKPRMFKVGLPHVNAGNT